MGRRLLPVRYLLPLFAVALATVSVFLIAGRAIDRQRAEDRHELADKAVGSIRDRIDAAAGSLHDGAAFINSSQMVTTDEFESYSAAALDRPAIRSYAYAERVDASERAAWERANRAQIKDFNTDKELVRAGERAVYYPVKFLEGPLVIKSRGMGFDGFGQAERHTAMAATARSGQPVATPPVRTPSGGWQPIFYQAVYHADAPVATAAQRERAVRGFIIAGIDVAQLAAGAASTLPGSPAIDVHDGDVELMRTSDALHSVEHGAAVTVGGREWMVYVPTPSASGPARYLHWGLLLVGLALVGVLWRLFDRAMRETEYAERMVAQRTAELAERNAQLLDLARFKDRMVGMVSHDLRSPLTAISGYVALLLEEEGGELTDEQRRWLTVAQRSADRLDRQIEDLLLSSHISEGSEFDLSPSSVDIARLATDVVEAAQPFAGQNGIDLSIEADASASIEADERRLGQVLDNLVSNAIKYTPDGGRVSVRVASSEDSVSVSVNDTGIGMNEADAASAFEPFARAGEAVDRGIRGTGLGLTIVRGVVEAHGGTVSVHTAPGRGSCFTIELPVRLRSSESLVTVADRKE